ncbi:MAG TPA: hypothetical protein VJO14_03580 [Bacteroidota bacterium]|nr:hypothetical protein [Bacteroidota bacterium]
MNKKLLTGFIAVYVVMVLTNYLIHSVMLHDTYMTLVQSGMMRGEMAGTMWIYFVTALVVAFFFTLIFSKGYNHTGAGEGIRYGLYVGLMMVTPFAYDSYASYTIPYSLALQWFLYGIVQYVILGMVVSMVYGSTKGPAAA